MNTGTALLIVDVQYDFLPGGSLAVADGNEILPVIALLLKGKWDVVAVSQDFHPQGHISFASTHGKETFTQIDVPYPYLNTGKPSTVAQMLWPDHCVQGTRGAEIEESIRQELKPWFDAGKSILVQKGTDVAVDAYSAFASRPDLPPESSPLTNELQERGIKKLYVVGLATDYCVRASSLDAKKVGFDTYIIKQGVRAVAGEVGTEKVQGECDLHGVVFVDLEDAHIQALL